MTAETGKTILTACVVGELLSTIPDLAYFFFGMKAKESLDGMLDASRFSLLKYVERMLELPRTIFLIVDALDEHPLPRNQLLEFLTGLSRNHSDRIHPLVVSRYESDVCAAMKGIGAAEVDLDMELKQQEDICKYVTGVLQSNEPFQTWQDSHPAIIDGIKHKLLKESMFRLVALQLDRLQQCETIDVETTLSALPASRGQS
ncbi:hypothetical protein B0H13DRAFT_2313440 [Mycena leptocephala]|nr:hypothetical protein B0H13DRAFT_2313440 [Mycena leptocephala]